VQVLRAVRPKDTLKHPVLKKMLDLIMSQDIVKSVRTLAEDDLEIESVINLPETEEFM
jgi:hypothetical protein